MPRPLELAGKHAIIVGSGPSLGDIGVLQDIRERKEAGDVIFACKAAVGYLADRGIHPDYSVSMDPGVHIASPEKIAKVKDTVHIIASSSDPKLFEYLREDNEHGDGAEVWTFHSACGLANEIELYQTLFPLPDVMGGGFNVVNRALALAIYMGCGDITLAGVDCGWRQDQEMYMNGPAHRPGVDMCDGGKVQLTDDSGDPSPRMLRYTELLTKAKTYATQEDVPPELITELESIEASSFWYTRPDMLASAVALARIAQERGDTCTILGDVLPKYLVTKDDAFLNQVASFKQG